MSAFSFLPRFVKKRKIETPSKQDQVSASLTSISTPAGPSNEHEGRSSENGRGLSPKGKGKAGNVDSSTGDDQLHNINKGYDLEDLARVVWLSLSDYALWSDADLRRKIDFASNTGPEGDGDAPDPNQAERDDGGYIPLSYLMKRSPAFLHAASIPSLVGQPEIAYVKAIRAHLSDLLEVRLILTDEASSSFGTSRWSTKKSPTGYEVKRKPTPNCFREYGKTDWDKLTIYVENIPTSYRNIRGVSKFLSSLLESSENSVSKIQHISFPPHHNDRPGTLSSCKGFALVTLSVAEDVQFLLQQWPWDETLAKDKHNQKDGSLEDSDVFQNDAVKFGLRCLSKGRWEELRAEYLLYRQNLVAELEADSLAQEKIRGNQTSIPQDVPPKPPIQTHIQPPQQSEPPQPETLLSQSKLQGAVFNASSPFPPECLVFVRNVHPETNKTTLRALFSQASKLVEGQADTSDGLDYLDYTKGLDSCYLRFSSPSHAVSFVKYFSDNSIIQTSALDGEGSPDTGNTPEGSTALIVMPELVTGKREELYWQKVPEKVRRQAVQKALNTTQSSQGGGSHDVASHEGQGKKRRRGK